MPITLQTFAATGETSYIAKHNANVQALISFLNSVENSLASLGMSSSSPANTTNIGAASYGTSGMNFVGTDSFTYSLNESTDILTLSAGFCWDAVAGIMIHKSTPTEISFFGAAAGTYYLRFDGTGTPYRDTVSSKAIYKVIWAGTSFTSVELLASYVPGAGDLNDLLTSAYSGLTYTSAAERLAATEKAFSAMLTANVASGNFTPTVAQAMEAAVLKITGAVSANRTITVPAKAKVYLVRNEFTGSYTVTVKTAAGTGVALGPGEHAIIYCDGTNVLAIMTGAGGGGGASTFLALSDTPDAYTGQANKLVKVKPDESGLEFSGATAPDVFTGLTDTPASYAGQAGKVPVVNELETGLEFSAPTTTFSALTDGPGAYAGHAYQMILVNGTENGLMYSTTAAPTSFLGLVDTPTAYTGMGGYTVKVKADGSGLEFVAGSTDSFLSLTDTPDNYASAALKFVRVNSSGNALEFTAVSLGTLLGLTDTPDSYAGAAFKVLTVKGDESGIEYSAMATPTSLLGLTDGPGAGGYAGKGGYTLKVKSDASGFEFVNVPAGITTFLGLTDVPASYTGQGGKGVRVNSGATALEFYTRAFAGQSDTPANYTGHAGKTLRVKTDESGVEFVKPPIMLVGAWNGVPAADAVVMRVPITTDMTLPASLTGSRAISEVAATAQTDFLLKKNGTTVATVRFAAGATTATFIAASPITLTTTDTLKLVGPATPDATLADLGFNFLGA